MNDDARSLLPAPTAAAALDETAEAIGYEAADPSLMATLWGDEPPPQPGRTR